MGFGDSGARASRPGLCSDYGGGMSYGHTGVRVRSFYDAL